MSNKSKKNAKQDENLPDSLEYPKSEDIFNRAIEEEKDLNDEQENFDMGLDVPGADLDDDDEKIGEEDEENNYYSLGGDNHEDLEEENPDEVDTD